MGGGKTAFSAGERYVVKWPVTDGRFAITVFLDRGCAEVFSADGLRMMPIPDRPIDPANRRLKVLECHGATDCVFKAWKLNSIWRPLSLFATAPSLSVVKDGKAEAEIVLGSDVLAPRVPNQTEAHQWAAEELQRWIAEITGAYVPIVRRDRPVGAKVRIVLQAQNAKKLFPKDWKAIGASDGYAIRTREADGVTEIHLFGTCPHGTLNAAFAFLEANSDIIWPRPDPAFEAVFSKSPDFIAKATDVLDVPVSRYRYRQWSGHGDFSNCRQADWSVRNRENDIGRGLARHATMMANGGGGHGMMKYANAAENFEKHPEWFTLFDGKRTPKTWWVCFCGDPEGLSDEFVKNIRLELDRRYPGVDPKNVKVDFFNLSGADSWNVCQCEACTKPFVCEDGTVVDPKDPAFRSAQCFTFMNKIARKLRKTHPDVVLGNYAYYITETPPPFRLDPNIRIQFCPYGENMKAPLDDPKANSYPARLLKAWGKACDKVCYRSYSGCGMNFPRQTEYIVQSNLLACLKQPLPIREFKDESHADVMKKGREDDVSLAELSSFSHPDHFIIHTEAVLKSTCGIMVMGVAVAE